MSSLIEQALPRTQSTGSTYGGLKYRDQDKDNMKRGEGFVETPAKYQNFHVCYFHEKFASFHFKFFSTVALVYSSPLTDTRTHETESPKYSSLISSLSL
jgi:hypothetical protein